MEKMKKVSEGLISSGSWYWRMELRRGFMAPSLRHQEPKHLSWQWLAKSSPEVTGCKDLCFSKICPKPSFFPSFKKHYIPKEKKSCTVAKEPMTWKEYFSYLLPDPVKKPPLITCRKLQAERRRACGDPHDYPGFCLNENCCPPAKEWFGQAVVYKIPNPFPTPVLPAVYRPCVEPYKTSIRPDEVCPAPHKSLDIDAYAYRRPFSNVCVCDSEYSLPMIFPCRRPCLTEPEKPEKSPACHYYSGIQGAKPPLSSDVYIPDLPVVMCTSSEVPPKPKPKEFQIEVKKGTCERHSFLKPCKSGNAKSNRKYHTLNNILHVSQTSRMYSVSANNSDPQTKSTLERSSAKKSWMEQNMCGHSSNDTKHIWNVSTDHSSSLSHQMNEMRAYSCNLNQFDRHYESSQFNSTEGISPKALEKMEKSNEKVRYGLSDQPSSTEPGPKTLIKVLSEETNKRLLEKAKETGERATSGFNTGAAKASFRNKFSLCKSRSVYDIPESSFSTQTVALSRKGSGKSDKCEKKKIICSGCPGVKQAEEDERNPPPKSFIDCKVRPAGRCRGPTRQLRPGEKEPDNPYYRHKSKPYSLCNKPRAAVCKKERGYKMPCEETKKKFHTCSFLMNTSAPAKFVPLYEIIKSRGNFKKERYMGGKTNPWDSHTVESYLEIPNSELVPDLSKIKGEQLKIFPETSFPPKRFPNKSNASQGFSMGVGDFKNSRSSMTKSIPFENSNNDKEVSDCYNNNNDSITKIPSLEAQDPINIWESKISAGKQNKDDEPKQSSNIGSEIGRGYSVSLQKPSDDNLVKSPPTKLSMMYSQGKKEKISKQESIGGMFSKNRGTDSFNPMEE